MQTNTIKVTGDILTKQLVGRIYAESDISKFRYEMLNYIQDLPKLSKNKFFVSLNFCGTNCLLVFTKIQDKFYSFVVDRQTLSYNFSKVDFSKIKLNQIKLSLDDSIYNGTIFEGILIKRHGLDDLYIISDVYKFCGKNMINDKLNIKLLTIVEYLKSNYDSESRDNNIEIQVNKIYELNKFDYFEKLYSPDNNFKPFATDNHPIYFEGKLASLNPEKNYNWYPWLGKNKKIENANVSVPKGETVYNLWLDGDGTYIVNGFGTTSIIGDGGILLRALQDNIVTEKEAMELLMKYLDKNVYVVHGAYIVSKVIGKLRSEEHTSELQSH